MRKLIAAFAFAVLAFGGITLFSATPVSARPIDCSTVRCIGCPDGFVLSPTPSNCCRCVRVH